MQTRGRGILLERKQTIRDHATTHNPIMLPGLRRSFFLCKHGTTQSLATVFIIIFVFICTREGRGDGNTKMIIKQWQATVRYWQSQCIIITVQWVRISHSKIFCERFEQADIWDMEDIDVSVLINAANVYVFHNNVPYNYKSRTQVVTASRTVPLRSHRCNFGFKTNG